MYLPVKLWAMDFNNTFIRAFFCVSLESEHIASVLQQTMHKRNQECIYFQNMNKNGVILYIVTHVKEPAVMKSLRNLVTIKRAPVSTKESAICF